MRFLSLRLMGWPYCIKRTKYKLFSVHSTTGVYKALGSVGGKIFLGGLKYLWIFSLDFTSGHFSGAQNFEFVPIFLENVRISGLQPVKTYSSLLTGIIYRPSLDVVCFLRRGRRLVRCRLAIHTEMHTNPDVMSVMFVRL